MKRIQTATAVLEIDHLKYEGRRVYTLLATRADDVLEPAVLTHMEATRLRNDLSAWLGAVNSGAHMPDREAPAPRPPPAGYEGRTRSAKTTPEIRAKRSAASTAARSRPTPEMIARSAQQLAARVARRVANETDPLFYIRRGFREMPLAWQHTCAEYHDGRTTEAAAKLAGWSKSTVRRNLESARRRLGCVDLPQLLAILDELLGPGNTEEPASVSPPVPE